MPPRRQWIVRRTRMAARNGARRDREFARAYGSTERVILVQSLPCVVCAATPCENAHTGRNHAGYKADADTIVPLCPAHHRELHRVGRATFERVHGVNLAMSAAETDTLVRRLLGGAA
jgi:hypothetical protein